MVTTSAAPHYTVHTTGVCDQEPGPGRWTYVAVHEGAERRDSGAQTDTTAVGMHLLAAIKALESTEPGSTVLVHTDSAVVQDGMTGWVHKWRRTRWRTGTGDLVGHHELWARLLALAEERTVQWAGPTVATTTGRTPAETPVAVDADARPRTDQAAEAPDVERGITGPAPQATDAPEPAPLAEVARRRAGLAECQRLEQRWAALYDDLRHLDQEWRHLLETGTSGARTAAQPLGWADGALLFTQLSQHATRVASLAGEALQTCTRYATALQRAVEDWEEP